jgi:hypothetical protein
MLLLDLVILLHQGRFHVFFRFCHQITKIVVWFSLRKKSGTGSVTIFQQKTKQGF